MHQRHDEVHAHGAHGGDVTARRLDDVDDEHLALEVGAVPLHDLGRHEADHADPEPLGGPGLVDELAIEDDEGLDQRRRRRAIRSGHEHVRRHNGEARSGERGAEEGEAVIELVVAQTGRGIAELIHRPVHRVNLSGLEWLLDGHVVAQRIALDRVTGIEEQRFFTSARACWISAAVRESPSEASR